MPCGISSARRLRFVCRWPRNSGRFPASPDPMGSGAQCTLHLVRSAGDVLLVACYEMGHQPLSVAWPAAVLEARGFKPTMIDLAQAKLEPGGLASARLVAI